MILDLILPSHFDDKMLLAARRLARTASTTTAPSSPSPSSLLAASVFSSSLSDRRLPPPFQATRAYRTNKAAGRTNVGRRIGNRQVAPEHWHFVDARGQVVGRLATEIVRVLTGKHKPTYLPYIDSGDHVVVTNARHVVLTGQKMDKKLYRWHTGYPGGLKERTAKEMLDRNPNNILRKAVNGMLPKNRLRKMRDRKLYIYSDEDHPHESQQNGHLKSPPLGLRSRGLALDDKGSAFE